MALTDKPEMKVVGKKMLTVRRSFRKPSVMPPDIEPTKREICF